MTIPLSSFALVAAAQSLIGLAAREDVRNALVDTMLRDAGLALNDPWDLAFIQHVGWQAHREPSAQSSSWPFTRTATRGEIAAIAQSRRLVSTQPKAGDIALLWSPDNCTYFGAAIVTRLEFVQVEADGRAVYRCRTIEGDVSDARGCWSVRERGRSVCPADGDLFVRWVRLDRRRRLGDPVETALACDVAA